MVSIVSGSASMFMQSLAASTQRLAFDLASQQQMFAFPEQVAVPHRDVGALTEQVSPKNPSPSLTQENPGRLHWPPGMHTSLRLHGKGAHS